MCLRISISLCFLLFSAFLPAQQKLEGILTDSGGTALPGALLRLCTGDSILLSAAFSDSEGRFALDCDTLELQLLEVTLSGFLPHRQRVTREQRSCRLNLILKEDPYTLEEVRVTALRTLVGMAGDTLLFYPGAVALSEDALAEELVAFLPGLNAEQTGLSYMGEPVQRVLVDGKAFFGEDASLALKTLPVSLIARIEIFDSQTENDYGSASAHRVKTLNIVTKNNARRGSFARASAGAGIDEARENRYHGGFRLNRMSDQRRLTLLAGSNNISENNFSNGEKSLAGTAGPGITSGQGAALDFTDEWKRRIFIGANYRVSNQLRRQLSSLSRNYYGAAAGKYLQEGESEAALQDHRMKMQLEYRIDTFNTLVFTPGINAGYKKTQAFSKAGNRVEENRLLAASELSESGRGWNQEIQGSLLYRHNWRTARRWLKLQASAGQIKSGEEALNVSGSLYADTLMELRQLAAHSRPAGSAAVKAMYSHPFSHAAQIVLHAEQNIHTDYSDRSVRDFSYADQEYKLLNPFLSNTYSNTVHSARAGINFLRTGQKLNFSLGTEAQRTVLSGRQHYPLETSIEQEFRNIFLNADLRYVISRFRFLNLHYYSKGILPSVQQLQNVTDMSNPMLVKLGNPGLKQSLIHNASLGYNSIGRGGTAHRSLALQFGCTERQIGTSAWSVRSDSAVNGYLIKAGSRITAPVNLDKAWFSGLQLQQAYRISVLPGSLSFRGAMQWRSVPGITDGQSFYTNNYSLSGGFAVNGGKPGRLAYTLSGNSSGVLNKNGKNGGAILFNQWSSLRVYWQPGRFLAGSDLSHSFYGGGEGGDNDQVLILNLWLGCRLLKSRSLELKFSAHDLLNQNRSISRTFTATYAEESWQLNLQRYYLLSLSWTFRHFNTDQERIESSPE